MYRQPESSQQIVRIFLRVSEDNLDFEAVKVTVSE